MSRLRMSFRQFCREVRRAVEELPEYLRPYFRNVVVDVQDYPDELDLEAGGPDRDPDALLLGLFSGVALSDQHYGDRLPNRIKVFRRPLEEISRSREELLMHIQQTVVHEFAHHVGFSEEDLEPFEAEMEKRRDALFARGDRDSES